MPRNSQFHPGREPLANDSNLNLRPSHVSGPFSFLNPTRAHYHQHHPPPTHPSKDEEDHPSVPIPSTQAHIERLWRSRDNRKGRHALRIDYGAAKQEPGVTVPPPTNTFGATARGLSRMATYAPYWDVSYLVAVSFTLGSAVWIVNAFFAWLPLVDPKTFFAGETLIGGGVTAIIGTTIFEIGSVLLLLEAINANQTGCFGWALEEAVKTAQDDAVASILEFRPNLRDCRHHHANRDVFLDQDTTTTTIHHHRVQTDGKERSFRWLPSTTELRTHYFHELGFIASLIQFISATIFWIAGITALPGIMNHMSLGLTDGVFWVPQIIGGMGFVTSGLLFTLETQGKWYIPAPHVLGWHVGFWNLIGGIGFTLCGALGPASGVSSGVAYQTSLATFWGSWSFMLGSCIQWYESLEKYPVENK